MTLQVENITPLLAADARTTGAAVKILVAGGSELSEAEARRAAGLSKYVWEQDGRGILDLVRLLECKSA